MISLSIILVTATNIVAKTTPYVFTPPNLTIIISVASFSIAIMTAIIKVLGTRTKISDEVLRESKYLKEIESKIEKHNTKTDKEKEEKEEKISHIKEIVDQNKIEIEKYKIKLENSDQNISEIKANYKDVVSRLDDVLKTITEFLND